jgi:hypothetical protein
MIVCPSSVLQTKLSKSEKFPLCLLSYPPIDFWGAGKESNFRLELFGCQLAAQLDFVNGRYWGPQNTDSYLIHL